MHQCKGTHPSSFKMPDRVGHTYLPRELLPMFSRERVDVRTTYSGVTRGTIMRRRYNNSSTLSYAIGLIFLCRPSFTNGFTTTKRTIHHDAPSFRRLHMSSQFSMDEVVPLNQIFQKAVVLQRSGDRSGALCEYKQFVKVANSQDVDPSLYVS